MSDLLAFLVIGGAAGWIGGQIMNSDSSNIVTNIIVGIVGSMVGGFLLSAMRIYTYGWIGKTVSATIGAVVLLFVLKMIKKN